MRYKLLSQSTGAKINCFDIQNEERNEKNEVTKEYKETPTGMCAYPVTLTLTDTESLNTSNFTVSKMFEVSCKLTIEEADKNVEEQIQIYLKEINA